MANRPVLAAVLTTVCTMSSAQSPLHDILFDQPADKFYESSPLGNGRLGAMVFGRTDKEILVLNESTMWSGSQQDSDRLDAHLALPKIQELLKLGQNKEAQELLQKNFVSNGPGSGFGSAKDGPYGCYQQFAELHIDFDNKGAVSDYHRRLNFKDAVSTVTFKKSSVDYHSTTFASAPDQVIVHRVSSSGKGSIDLTARLVRTENAEISATSDSLLIKGQLKSGNPAKSGVRYFGIVKVLLKGGSLTTQRDSVRIQGAEEVTFIFSGGTSMFGSSFESDARKRVGSAAKKPFDRLISASTKSHRQFYDRVDLDLPTGPSATKTSLKRLASVHDGENDPSLAGLLFNYGRYLLISSSRPDSPLPANLQGIWARELQTPWNGDFHLNINVQMNYWLAESTNLSDCHKPLLDFIPKLVPNGKKTAKAYYNANGWVAHVITNPWHYTSPGEHASWGSTLTSAGWLAEHLFDHYDFTRHQGYLAKVYPTIKGAAEFFLETLIAEPKNGWLVTAPSNSPENSYFDASRNALQTCMGPTMDRQIIYELFTNTINSAEILGRDKEFVEKLKVARAKLSPMQVGKKGNLMEWLEDYDEPEPHHRHVSHLYGLHPGNQITPSKTPDLAEAARKTLELRGDDGTGWSLAWKVCFWARLEDGERCEKLIKRLLRPTGTEGFNYSSGGGTYANLFGAHPPFQIDSNFGVSAGIAEMLVQSDGESVRLLPALPKSWSRKGHVRGLTIRGGSTVNISWKNGLVTSHQIVGPNSKKLKVSGPGIQ